MQITDEKAAVVTVGSFVIGGEAGVALAKERMKIVATARRINEGKKTEHLDQIHLLAR